MMENRECGARDKTKEGGKMELDLLYFCFLMFTNGPGDPPHPG